ncbi:unnamed protein product, partial [Rotaria magnacalcarata]
CSSNDKLLTYRLYNLREFKIAHNHYSVVVHSLGGTERTFYTNLI